MKAISNTLLTEQIKPSTKPVVKAQIQTYDFPAKSSTITFQKFDRTSVLTANVGAGWACCASDGSFVITKGTGVTTVRFENPDYDTDFTTWGASGDEGTFNAALTFCIAANPTSAEVIIVYLSDPTYVGNTATRHLYRQESADYGATWGSATDMATISWDAGHDHVGVAAAVRLAYNPAGDLAIVVGYNSPYQGPPESGYNLILKAWIRRSGTWGSVITSTTQYDKYRFTLGDYVQWEVYNYGNSGGGSPYITVYGFAYLLIVLESLDIAYDEDWFVAYSASQTQAGSEGGSGRPVTKGQIIYGNYYKVLGNGTYVSGDTWYVGGEISLVETKAEITTLSQMTHFAPSPPTKEELAYELRTMPVLMTMPALMNMSAIHPALYLHKMTGYPLLLSLWSEGRAYICELRGDSNVKTAVFDKANTFVNDRPVRFTSNSTYLFGYNGDQIFISSLPVDWTVSTIGTGAGDSATPTNKIIGIREQAARNQTSRLVVTYDNANDYFDSPGAGALVVLQRGSRINLLLGYEVGGVDYTEEYARYFVDSWSYTRKPNRSIFELNCVDMWGLLENYRFNCKVNYNYDGAGTTYSIYQLINLICQAVGGSLTYINKSSSIDTLYPVFEVSAGDNAASALRRLLSFVPDQIKFFGNAGTIYYPQTSDDPIYYYTGAS